jgi:NAD-dependent deacetylase
VTEETNRILEFIRNADKLVVFSGAGLSAESGIPTYRGAGGLWSKYDPSKYADIQYFLQDPSYYWRFFKEERYPILSSARPNTAHYALIDLEKKGQLILVITQNIDGLHQEAGQKKVCELHGNTRRIICLECDRCYHMDEVYQGLKESLPPHCQCGGLLKPDVVLFGEPLPQKALDTAWQSARECDTFLVIGSSLVVNPAAQIPLVAKQNGARLLIVNIDPTPLDELADVVIHGSASEVLLALQ